ncbi:gustatory and odorant receptor 22-like [Neodiprion pinetum]|uniref:Gustatory receptor n=1 Tax=Neodiprion lecontei TaxID=441921 RepID=A0ABM3GMC4_NEOLC|nr:gustatory and odorant receptor 22-like [Neodiprion pinetum]XP_046601425.1 gustatory and odorant receptor 22-like [Neodiprion lecontei]XP_046629333.1 gustatory and odorant receptor 22-like [Neodiprion virginianus]
MYRDEDSFTRRMDGPKLFKIENQHSTPVEPSKPAIFLGVQARGNTPMVTVGPKYERKNQFSYNEDRRPEQDGKLLDKFDHFYDDTKVLLILFQIMGVMPIQRGIGTTTFEWTSTATIYAMCLWVAETVVVILVGRERIENTLQPDKPFDEYIYNIIFLCILTPHFLLPIASWRYGGEVAKYKNMWTHYQLRYYRVTGSILEYPNLKRMCIALCIISWLISIGVVVSQFYLQPGFTMWHTSAYYHIIAMLDCLCALWWINCTAIGSASKGLALNLHKALENTESADLLVEYRALWLDLSHMMQQLAKAYANMYGIYCLIMFVTTIIAGYGAFSEILDHGFSLKELGLFVIVAYCTGLLYIICNEADHATRKVGLDFQERLLNVNLAAVNAETKKEVEMFLVSIANNPPVYSLNGYTVINRELLSSNLATMVTYWVVLMQFKLSLIRRGTGNPTATISNLTATIDSS